VGLFISFGQRKIGWFRQIGWTSILGLCSNVSGSLMPSVLESGDSVLALWSTRIFKLGFGVVRIWGWLGGHIEGCSSVQ
jgi:hypothetical protein